ncbi:YdeI/OmpD-associated family protein [Flavobacterium suaedae]|nr:YdeI/OmpD-associated family protein [Flavobacterium suaedae]
MTFISCNNKEEHVTLTVENEYISYVDSSETIQFNNYKNDSIRKKATNVITYTINNPTDKKLLFIIDRETVEPMFSETYSRSVCPGFYIRDKNDKLMKPAPGIADNFDIMNCTDCRGWVITHRMDDYEKLGITKSYSRKVDNYLRNSVTVYPGETKTFKSIIMFPIFLELNTEGFGGGILRYKSLNDANTFQLFYEFHADEYKNVLPKYILEEIENNETEFFDGRLLSNKVPLKKYNKLDILLINKTCLLEKFPGKGGWTYARMPEIKADKTKQFGMVRVKGTIDDYEINNYNLMPMGNGELFLPVKAAIRKKIKKEAGGYVNIALYLDNAPVVIPEEIKLCLQNEPNAYETFCSYTDGEQKAFIDWIYAAKQEKTKVKRIVTMLKKIEKHEKV